MSLFIFNLEILLRSFWPERFKAKLLNHAVKCEWKSYTPLSSPIHIHLLCDSQYSLSPNFQLDFSALGDFWKPHIADTDLHYWVLEQLGAAWTLPMNYWFYVSKKYTVNPFLCLQNFKPKLWEHLVYIYIHEDHIRLGMLFIKKCVCMVQRYESYL